MNILRSSNATALRATLTRTAPNLLRTDHWLRPKTAKPTTHQGIAKLMAIVQNALKEHHSIIGMESGDAPSANGDQKYAEAQNHNTTSPQLAVTAA